MNAYSLHFSSLRLECPIYLHFGVISSVKMGYSLDIQPLSLVNHEIIN